LIIAISNDTNFFVILIGDMHGLPKRIVNRGRDPNLRVYCDNNEVPMRDCAHGILRDMKTVAEQLDIAHTTTIYSDSLENQILKVDDDNLTPSARILQTMSNNNQSHLAFVKRQTELFANEFNAHKLDPETEGDLLASAKASLVKQNKLEEDTSENFEEFLEAYYHGNKNP